MPSPSPRYLLLLILALISILGGLIWLIAAVFGLGALTVAQWKARSRHAMPV